MTSAALPEAEILAVLPLRPRPALYLVPVPRSGDLMVQERGREGEGDAIIGLAVHDPDGWYLGCIECRAEIEEADSGMCRPCRQDRAIRDEEFQRADDADTR